jgi:hypothetical protein
MSFCTYNLQANRTKKDLENLAKAFGFDMEIEIVERASARLYLRLTPKQKKELYQCFLDRKSKHKSYSLTRFILDLCFSNKNIDQFNKTVDTDKIVINAIMVELSKQGNNINQIAKKINTVTDNKVIYNETKNLKEYLRENQEIIKKLKQVLLKK